MAKLRLTGAQKEQAKRALFRDAVRARECPNAFIEFIGRTEGNKPVVQSSVHRAWQDHLSANQHAIIRAPVGGGKSSQLRWRILWELGRNPNLRVAIISASKEGNPRKFMSAIQAEILNNKRLHYAFPKLRPQISPKKDWSAYTCTVERTDRSADPSIQLFGLEGHILGSRLDLVIMDDLHNPRNVLQETSRDKIFNWVSGAVTSRGPQDGSMRMWLIGHRFHKRDVLERLEKESGYAAINYSAFVRNPDTGEEEPLIPHMMSIEHLRSLSKKLGVLAGPMLRNELTDLENAQFKQEWFDKCLAAGTGLKMVREWNSSKAPTFTGVDLSTGKVDGDYTAICTIAVLPDSTRRLLDMRRGRWKSPEIKEQILDVHNRYSPIICVESAGQQDLFTDMLADLDILTLRKYNTTANKHWGILQLASEFESGCWQLPNLHYAEPDSRAGQDTPERRGGWVPGPEEIIHTWISEMTNYTPKDHTGDLLMASFIARECAKNEGYSHDGIGNMDDIADFLDADTLQLII